MNKVFRIALLFILSVMFVPLTTASIVADYPALSRTAVVYDLSVSATDYAQNEREDSERMWAADNVLVESAVNYRENLELMAEKMSYQLTARKSYAVSGGTLLGGIRS